MSTSRIEQPEAFSKEAGNTTIITKMTEFHCFPNLPVELRQLIFEFSVPGPRVVEMDWFVTIPSENATNFLPISTLHRSKDRLDSISKSRNVPSILHVCKESREIGKLAYKLHDFRVYDKSYPIGRQIKIYLDLLRDSLFFLDPGDLYFLHFPGPPPRLYDVDLLSPILHFVFEWDDWALLAELLKSTDIQAKTITLVRREYETKDWLAFCRIAHLGKDVQDAGEISWGNSQVEKWKLAVPEGVRMRYMEYHEDGLALEHLQGDVKAEELAEENTTTDDECSFPNPHIQVDFSAYRRSKQGKQGVIAS